MFSILTSSVGTVTGHRFGIRRPSACPSPRASAMDPSVGPEPEGEDPTIKALMAENFGPPDGEDEGRLERGLSKVQELTSAERGESCRWLHSGNGEEDPVRLGERVCFRCGNGGSLSSCAKCGVAAYCGQDCQRADWGKKGAFGGHKLACDGYKALGRLQQVAEADRRLAFERLLAKVRLHMCPFAVHHGSARGAGIILVQSENSLAELTLPVPRDCSGRRLERSVILQHLLLEELDEMRAVDPCADELARARDAIGAQTLAPVATGPSSQRELTGGSCRLLTGCAGWRWDQPAGAGADGSLPTRPRPVPHPRLPPAHRVAGAAVEGHDAQQEVVVLGRLRCGFVGALVAPLVPEYRVCVQLAEEYAGRDALQLDLDDSP